MTERLPNASDLNIALDQEPCSIAGPWMLKQVQHDKLEPLFFPLVTLNLFQGPWPSASSHARRLSTYRTYRLVHFELLATMSDALSREKQLKRWHRRWKINLIETDNLEWQDIAFDIGAGPVGQAMDAETSSA